MFGISRAATSAQLKSQSLPPSQKTRGAAASCKVFDILVTALNGAAEARMAGDLN